MERNTGPRAARKQPGCWAVYVLDGAGLEGDTGAAELRVEGFDAQGKDLLRACGRSYSRLPVHSLPQGVTIVGAQQ